MKRNSEKCVFIYVEENRLYILSKIGHLDIIECLEGEKVYKRMLKKAKSKAKKVWSAIELENEDAVSQKVNKAELKEKFKQR